MDYQNKRLKLIKQDQGMEYYVYTPTFFHPVLESVEKISLKKRLRYMRNYLRKERFVVYYLKDGGELVSMCAVTPGGKGLKTKFATPHDIILGPSYTIPKFRNKGYSKALLKFILANHPDYTYAYGIIANGNLSSIHASKACGFELYQEMRLVGIFRKQCICESNSTHQIIRFVHP